MATKCHAPLFWLVFLFLIVAAPAPKELVAQECGFCHSIGDNIHYAPDPRLWGGGPVFGVGPGIHGWHGYLYYGSCTYSHGVCIAVGGGSASAGSQTLLDPLQLTDEVAEAVLEGDVQRLAHLASHPSFRITRQRMALQIIGCAGAVVGHVPIGSKLMAPITAPAVDGLGESPDS